MKSSTQQKTKHLTLLKRIVGLSLLLVACCSQAATVMGDLGRSELSLKALEKKWGIQVASVRLSGNGNLVDFRYRVLDPDKAAGLADREAKPFLVDQSTGAKLFVPRTPKIGPLRQTAQKLEPGKTHFMLFSNPGKFVKAGSKVTVAVGDFRVENLIVE
jgi:hypothetical protein